MTYMYTAQHSVVLLRTKKHDQTLRPNCRKLDLYGKMDCAKLGGFNLWVVLNGFWSELTDQMGALLTCLVHHFYQSCSLRAKHKMINYFQNFEFLQK